MIRISPEGKLVETIEVPGVTRVSCPAFGGPDYKTLYITTAREHMAPEEIDTQPHAGSVFAINVDVPGLPEPLADALSFRWPGSGRRLHCDVMRHGRLSGGMAGRTSKVRLASSQRSQCTPPRASVSASMTGGRRTAGWCGPARDHQVGEPAILVERGRIEGERRREAAASSCRSSRCYRSSAAKPPRSASP